MSNKFIKLTFYREPDCEGYGGRPTEKVFHIAADSIEYMVEYTAENCTKLCLKSGKEMYVVESSQEIMRSIFFK